MILPKGKLNITKKTDYSCEWIVYEKNAANKEVQAWH